MHVRAFSGDKTANVGRPRDRAARSRSRMLVCAALAAIAAVVAVDIRTFASEPVADKQAVGPSKQWAFQPLSDTQPPSVQASDSAATPVDAFLIHRLETAGLGFSPPADRVTLMRRLHMDLIGLPPQPADVQAFLADTAPDAYERLVDRLLASPHFGERWGRHWLDAVGYTDTVGFDTDATNLILSEGKWRYRDWVINAFNSDKPYDRFVTEQLAGDELAPWRTSEHYTPEIVDSLIATGFLRTARDYTHEPESTIPLNYYEVLHDTVEIVGSSLLGLTLNCARCHDHKFDPLTQHDYYSVMALLTPSYNPGDWRVVMPYKDRADDRTLPDVSPADKAVIDEHNQRVDDQIAGLRERIEHLRQPARDKLLETRLAALPEAIRQDVRTAFAAPPDQRGEVQRYLSEKFGDLQKFADSDIEPLVTEEERAAVSAVEAEIATTTSGKRSYGKIQALFEVGTPPATHLLVGGDFTTPSDEVAPGFLSVLTMADGANLAPGATPPDSPATGSGRRLALAQWLTQPDAPPAALLARVMANRVWQHLFGEGLVSTPENFGAQGSPPTHPELLDWLSGRFIAEGWRVKPLVKLLVTSHAYRQSSRADADAAGAVADPQNWLLWRMRLRRLESEVIRDSVLAVAGTLSSIMGGPPVLLRSKTDGAVEVDPDKLENPDDGFRRSVYLLTRRAYNDSLLTVFDQPVLATTCQRRDASAVPLQSLTMLNSGLLLAQSARVAERVKATAGSDPAAQVQAAFRLILVRDAEDEEATLSQSHLAELTEKLRAGGMDQEKAASEALAQLCHTLLNTSEFLYVE